MLEEVVDGGVGVILKMCSQGEIRVSDEAVVVFLSDVDVDTGQSQRCDEMQLHRVFQSDGLVQCPSLLGSWLRATQD